jgi:aminoglycoside phosphotransferase (APT) family kinase protein
VPFPTWAGSSYLSFFNCSRIAYVASKSKAWKEWYSKLHKEAQEFFDLNWANAYWLDAWSAEQSRPWHSLIHGDFHILNALLTESKDGMALIV